MQKPAETNYPIIEPITQRWSPRTFNSQPVPKEVLMSLLEAARWAPSSRNEQPWFFIITTQQDNPEAYQRLYNCLSEGNQRWAGQAPILMLAVARPAVSSDGHPNRFAWYDTGQAVAYLSIQATAHNLYLHQMGGFSADKARAATNIPAEYEPVVAIALGYMGDATTLPEDIQARNAAPRSRKALESFVFSERWGNPFNHMKPR